MGVWRVDDPSPGHFAKLALPTSLLSKDRDRSTPLPLSGEIHGCTVWMDVRGQCLDGGMRDATQFEYRVDRVRLCSPMLERVGYV